MEKIEWSDALSVGVKEIDEQHQKLFGIINDLFDAKLQGKDSDVVSDIISKLVEYIDYHFGTEESYMTRFRFTGLMSHRNEHREFIKKVFELRRQHLEDKEDLSYDVLTFLTNWIRNHIADTDSSYKQCFLEHGLQ